MISEESEARETAAVEGGITGVADHDRIEFRQQGAERLPLGHFEIVAGAGNDRQLVVRIDTRVGIAREMLAAAEHTLLAHGAVEGPGIARHGGGVMTVGAVAERVVGFVIEGDIEHGREVEIEAEEPEQVAGQRAVALNQADVVPVPAAAARWAVRNRIP